MKRVESESFFKGFLLFFLSLGLLNTILFVFEYRQKQHDLDEKILTEMKLCSFDLQCTQFDIGFAPLETENLYKLYKNETGLFAFFSIPKSTTHAIRLTLSHPSYEVQLKKLRNRMMGIYLGVMIGIALISVLFSLYALYPLKRALQLTEEFSKDILHDFNTPLSSLRLNIRMLTRSAGDEKKIERIEQSIETILALQENLRSYLDEHPLQNDSFDLSPLLKERIALIRKNYPDIVFDLESGPLVLFSNQDALTRILDNLFSNAAKYNRSGGRVTLTLDPSSARLIIEDTGKGIVHPKRVFERFYKEQERGLGIGLHIVKKLCDALGIGISLKSTVDVGTTFVLDLSGLIQR